MTAERFWSKVDRRGPDECWPWLAARNEHGYGIFRLPDERRNVRAHRMAYSLTGHDLADSDVLRHSCDNPPCVNPAHLEPGTQADNVADAVARKRHKHGDRGAIKLTARAVVAIRERVAAGERQDLVAADHGVSGGMVNMIVQGKRWAHVGGPLARPRTHCVNGHELTEENREYRPTGRYVCRRCLRESQRRYRERKREAQHGQ